MSEPGRIRADQQRRIRVVHLVYSFSIGGLENVIVQLINRLPAERFEHVLVSLTSIGDFSARIQRPDVRFIELHKPPGHAVSLYPRIYRLLRELRPDVLHSCNLAALEIAPLAWLARVPRRIHVEHGWDAHDRDGSSRKYQLLRRCYQRFVSHFVSVSADLDRYLAQRIDVSARRRSLVANGVDTALFAPTPIPIPTSAPRPRPVPAGCPFEPGQHFLIGTVGRLQTVKNQPLLARAFVRLVREQGAAADPLRLLIIGEGPLREPVEAILAEAGLSERAWLPGARDDVAAILPALDCFVLPSQAEGTSCTLQEAMACGLAVVATAVGGTPDLILHERTGLLVPSDDEAALAAALWRYFGQAALRHAHGVAARHQALQSFALDGMVQAYERLFDPAQTSSRTET